jgi:hypothetical protein
VTIEIMYVLLIRLTIIVLGFLCGAFATIHLVKWIEKQSKFPLGYVLLSILLLMATTAGRTAVLIGWFSGLCAAYYPQWRLGAVERAMAWIQIISGAIMAVTAAIIFPDNFIILFCLLAWATSALITGILILRNKPLVLIDSGKPVACYTEESSEEQIRTVD